TKAVYALARSSSDSGVIAPSLPCGRKHLTPTGENCGRSPGTVAMMSLYGIVATTDARNAHYLPKCHTPGSSPGPHVDT
ncbi:hypothetical protein, partial [Cutibacterium sp.]|uniref:hypothetical protein n=1 Tax=Cutibacterium sp. TaxID=1912221 RepID=UPI002585D960